jgi:hypothetical protein
MIANERFASLQLVSYPLTPGTGTREKMERLLRKGEDFTTSRRTRIR